MDSNFFAEDFTWCTKEQRARQKTFENLFLEIKNANILVIIIFFYSNFSTCIKGILKLVLTYFINS